MNKWFVSRQNYWGVEPDEALVVEIAGGGADYANADMLADTDGLYRKLGCDQEYIDPRTAVNVAIAIREEWARHTDEPVRVEKGHTGGMTIPFLEFPTDEELHAWATKRWDEIEKCENCAEPVGDNFWYDPYDQDMHYCSQLCCDQAMAAYYEDIRDDDEEDW